MSTDPLTVDDVERIKIGCLTDGIKLSPEAVRLLRGPDDHELSIHEYPTTGGVTFVLGDDVYINAPFDEAFCVGAEVKLGVDSTGAGLEVRLGDIKQAISRVLPLPGYLGQRDESGRYVTDVMMSHGDRLRCSPFVGCAYDCSFCDLPGEEYVGRGAEQVMAAFDIASQDDALPPRHMLISGGSPRKAHYGFFGDTCEAIVHSSPIPVDIMMSPMVDGYDFVDRMVDAGVDGFSINLELFSDEAAREHLGRKYRTSRDHFDSFVSRAVERLGSGGRVRSLIIPGLEPLEATLQGVEHIASLGADPVLSPFRPAAGTAACDLPPPTPAAMRELLNAAREIVARHQVALGPECLPCQHNTLTFPWDARAHE